MISIIYIFWMYVILFAVIGMLRGWAKELLVGFSVVVAVALNFLLHAYAPMVKNLPKEDLTLFWVRAIVLVTLVYFGYQTVISVARLQAGARRERLQDSLFGLFLGAINGYLVTGSSGLTGRTQAIPATFTNLPEPPRKRPSRPCSNICRRTCSARRASTLPSSSC